MDKIKNLVITDDVLTSGTTAIETIEIVKKYIDIDKLDVHIVVGFAKNPEKVKENLKRYKITPHWIATRNEVLSQMWPSFNNIQRVGLKTEFTDFKEVIEELDKKR